MPWEPWPTINEGQIYNVQKCRKDAVYAGNTTGFYWFSFEATSLDTLNTFKSCQHILSPIPGGTAIALRHTANGWERWVE